MKDLLYEILPGMVATAAMGAILFALLFNITLVVSLWRRWRSNNPASADVITSRAEDRRAPASTARSRARP